MIVIAWTIVGLTALFIICSCIKSCVRIATMERFKNVPIQTPTLITDKNKIIQSLFDDDVEKFFKYKGITFWYYKDSKDYFEKQSFSVADVKNKIAQKYDELKQEHPGITDFFVSMTKQNNYLTWEFDPIDLNSYVPPKSTKDICIDELNKLIENNKIKEKHDI
jgi:hypothetical protein